MKKIVCVALALAAVLTLAVLLSQKTVSAENTEFLRIHIRADSNDEADQAVKYKVKTAVVDYLTPFLTEADSKEKAMSVVQSRLSGICAVADGVLAENGFSYKSRARLSQERFPTRGYDGVVLPSGVYDALIVDLGSGSGDNWWCVVYPPLCFVGGEGSGGGVTYKWKIAEIVERWKNR